MASSSFPRSLLCTLALACGVLMACSEPTLAAAKSAKAKPAAEQAGAEKEASKSSGRLPMYYRQVVTDDQRDQIYKIQAEYMPKVRELQTQLDTLKKDEAAKIEAVLKPEQKEKIEKLKAETESKRKAAVEKAAETKAPAKKAEPAK